MASSVSPCGNCAHNCCCRCQNPKNCFYCSNYCCYNPYKRHMICLTCRIGWKPVTENKYSKFSSWSRKNPPKCKECGKNGIRVGLNLRVPGKRKDKEWILLERILIDSFREIKENFVIGYIRAKNIEYDGIGDLWLKRDPEYFGTEGWDLRQLIFEENHTNPKDIILYPGSMAEYKRFIDNMKKEYTKNLTAQDRWNIIRMSIKLGGVIKYWKK